MVLYEYPLSPTILPGNNLGLPLLARLITPCSINCSNTVASCCWPGVSTKQTGLPLPSHRTCILVLNPPLLQPKASSVGLVGFSGSPFLHLRRSGEHEHWCRPRSELSTEPRPGCLPFAVAPRAPGPTHLLYASDTGVRRRSLESRNVRANPPIGHLS